MGVVVEQCRSAWRRTISLKALAEGAYLHDVGKAGIPTTSSTSPSPHRQERGPGSRSTSIVGTDIVGRAYRSAKPSR